MKINRLEIENTKRIRAVSLEPAENGLTVIGGNNNQGKTSILDAIAWTLGGEKYRPSSARREGSVVPPYLRVTMDNGLIVERKGENSALKVTDPEGRKGGQQLLNEFVEQLAIDLPRFMESPSREKAKTLLRIIGVEKELTELEISESRAYTRRTEIGRLADQKQKYADELPLWSDVPKQMISATELILKQQEILARNGENARLRDSLTRMQSERESLKSKIDELSLKLAELDEKIELASRSAAECRDESTDEIHESLMNIEKINKKIADNCAREKAEIEAEELRGEYDLLTAEITGYRESRKKLLDSAKLPLPGLSVDNGELMSTQRLSSRTASARIHRSSKSGCSKRSISKAQTAISFMSSRPSFVKPL